MWLRCDIYRRYARLTLAGLHDVDYRSKAFSCSLCGSEAYFCLVQPTKECTIIVCMSVSSRSSSDWRQASPPSYLKESFSLVR